MILFLEILFAFFKIRDRVNTTSFSAVSSSRLEEMVDGDLVRSSAFRVGLGVSGATIVSGSCTRPSHSRISRVLTSSLSLGVSSLFCRGTQCALSIHNKHKHSETNTWCVITPKGEVVQ